jgi:hypothetical protein
MFSVGALTIALNPPRIILWRNVTAEFLLHVLVVPPHHMVTCIFTVITAEELNKKDIVQQELHYRKQETLFSHGLQELKMQTKYYFLCDCKIQLARYYAGYGFGHTTCDCKIVLPGWMGHWHCERCGGVWWAENRHMVTEIYYTDDLVYINIKLKPNRDVDYPDIPDGVYVLTRQPHRW